MESSQDYQEQLQLFRILREQQEMYTGQMEILNVSRSNIMNTKITIENIKEGVEENDEILIPIGGMANFKASIKNPEKVLLAITQDVIIEKDLDGAIELLDKRIEQHDKEIEIIRTQLHSIDLNLQKITQLIQRGYRQQ
ncbi:MAG: prefoldin subunit alpha [Candidatus Thorarchaeota archaeon]